MTASGPLAAARAAADQMARHVGSRRLPKAVADRARAHADGRQTPTVPRDAATVVLLRDDPDGMVAYTLRRVASMAFGAGMYVFPGGTVDPRDADDSDPRTWSGPPPAEFAARLGAPEALARALVCAAVRETFEESGVLLAGPDGSAAVTDTSGSDWEADRQALISKRLGLTDFLRSRDLVLRADLLRPWAHWVTPQVEPRRFDTRFFVAAVPPGQCTRPLHEEADRVEWVRPADALARWEAGELAMMPPTLVTMAEVGALANPQAVLAAAGQRVIARIEPRVEIDGEVATLVLPGDAGYP